MADIGASVRSALPGAAPVEEPDLVRSLADDELEVTVFLRPAGSRAPRPADEAEDLARLHPRRREYRSADDLDARFAADPADVAAVHEVAKRAGLAVTELPPVTRALRLRGPLADVAELFRTTLRMYTTGQETYRGRDGTIGLPDELAGRVEAVLGLDDRRVATVDHVIPSHVIPSHVIPSHVIPSHVIPSHTGVAAGVIPSHGVADPARVPDEIRSAGVIPSHVIPSHVIPSHVIPSHVIPSHGGLAEGTLGFGPQGIEGYYDFPPSTPDGDVDKPCIGIVALTDGRGPKGERVRGGFHEDLVRQYVTTMTGLEAPEIATVTVRGRGNQPAAGTDDGIDSTDEVMLDVQLVSALAPHARVVVYFSESTEQGFVEALWGAVTDTENDPSVLLICYGTPEDVDRGQRWTRMAIEQAERAFAAAALRGITVVTSCGDNGAADAAWSTRVYADYPASSPWVLGCGGTTAAGALELVWNDGHGATGGGVSRVFGRPAFQSAAGVPPSVDWSQTVGRGVPDVAAVGDPRTGVWVYDGEGRLVRAGGTSVSAPIWAALIARLQHQLGYRLGFLNPQLYELQGSPAFRNVVLGDNGAYRAGPGWDPCTGLGTPVGTALLDALR